MSSSSFHGLYSSSASSSSAASSSSSSSHSATALSTKLYVPSDIGFVHTQKDRFTHFSESNAGIRTTFGMSSEDLAKLMETFLKSTVDKEGEIANKLTPNLLNELLDLIIGLTSLAKGLKDKTIYRNAEEMIKSLLDTGHIPLILSGAAPAAQYEIATRSVSAGLLRSYLFDITRAGPQAREYCVKHNMMKRIEAFRQSLYVQRSKLVETDQDYAQKLYLYNRIIMNLEAEVIKKNQQTMPKNCEQFDLCSRFREEIRIRICQMDQEEMQNCIRQMKNNAIDENIVAQLFSILNCDPGNSYDLQKAISDKLYEALQKFIDTLGLGLDQTGVIKIDKNKDAILQEVLTLIAYLNSEHNPFARDGVYGEIVTNAFHEEALRAYKKHEARETEGYSYAVYTPQKGDKVKFTDDQMEQLLYGSENQEQAEEKRPAAGFLADMTATFLNMTGSGARSLSDERRQRLNPPVPKQFLLEAAPQGKEEEKQKFNMKMK